MLKQNIKHIILVSTLGLSLLYASGDNLSQQQEFQKIAVSYLKYSANHNFPEWKTSTIEKLTPFYSSNGDLLAYEASIIPTQNGQMKKQGYLFINVTKDKPLISTFSTTGESISAILKAYWENTYANQVVSAGLEVLDFKFLISPPSGYAIGVKLNGEASFLDEATFQDGYYIFTPFPDAKKLQYTYHKPKQSRTLKSNSQERIQFKKALLEGDYNSFFFQTESKKEIKTKKKTRDTKSISASFAPYHQEKSYWNDDRTDSYAGCGPIAWSILYEYWDERGYGNLIGSAAFNSYYDVKDQNVINMISLLREYMSAFIMKDKQTGVWQSEVVKGIYYAHHRGYNNFTAYSTTDNRWEALKQSINENKPSIAFYQYNYESNHIAVAYNYIDNYGSQNDIFCVRTGWEYPQIECKNTSYLLQTTVVNPAGNTPTKTDTSTTKYGAVAVSTANPHALIVGAKWNTTSREYAIDKAMEYCKQHTDKGCQLLTVIKDNCFALAQIPNENNGNYSVTSTLDKAQENALYYCNQRTDSNDCFIKLAFCSNNSHFISNNPSTQPDIPLPKLQIDPPVSHNDTYTAIAIAVNNGKLIRWGKSWNKSSLYEAKQAALKGCARSECKVIITGENQCISLAKVKNKDKGAYQKSNTYYEAEVGALNRCKNRDSGECFTVATVCSNGNH